MSHLHLFKKNEPIHTTVNILFLKKFVRMKQLTSSLAMKHFVRFLPYMGLDNKNLLYYAILSFHKQQQQQQQNNSNKLCLLFTLVMKVDYSKVLLLYTGCHRRNGPNFGRVFLMLNYTDITQNTYIQS